MWESFEQSVHSFLLQTLSSPQHFRLTIDLKKLKFACPYNERVLQDSAGDYVDSISLSYLTSPVFKSNDVFHAVIVRPNPRDVSDLLITDGFCSFRFEDKLLWSDFVQLFVASGKTTGAVLPIYLRARQEAEKCSTLGVATLNFSSFLSVDRAARKEDLPPLFFMTCAQSVSDGSRAVDLPIFEILLRLPVIAKDNGVVVAMLTVGIAIDLMNVTLDPKIKPPLGRSRDHNIPQIVSAPSVGRAMEEDFSLMERCLTEIGQGGASTSYGRYATPQIVSSVQSPGVAPDAESSGMQATGKDHLIQCEMMLLKLNAEQAHQKFREEVKLIEAKSEERIEAIRKENQKLRNENRQLEKKLIEFEQKLQVLQETIVKPPPPCSHVCSNTSSEVALRRENERLQLLLKVERQKTQSDAPESGVVPHAHSVHPVYHDGSRTPVYKRPVRNGASVPKAPPSSSSSSNTDSSPLSSRSRQLLAYHLKRTA